MTKTTTSIAAKRNTTRTSSTTATRTASTARSTSGTATRTSNTATRTSTTARRSGTSTARRSASTRRASASKKGSGYNKYVPVFIDNYAEQRSAKLRAKLGWQAYGIYLAILQRLRSEKDCTLELDYESLALSFWTDEDNLRAIIEDFNLFAINRQEGTFYSPLLDSMLSTLDPSLAQSRAPRRSKPVENEEECSAVDDAEDCTETDACEYSVNECDFSTDVCACSADACEMMEEEDDFSDENFAIFDENVSVLDENSSISDKKSDVTEKEFRVKEKEIEIFAPFFSEETEKWRVADDVSMAESEEAQNCIPQDAPNAQNDVQNDSQFDAQNDAEFDAKNSAKSDAKSDAKSVLQMCTNMLQEDALQSDANEHFSTAPHARVNKQTNKRTNKPPLVVKKRVEESFSSLPPPPLPKRSARRRRKSVGRCTSIRPRWKKWRAMPRVWGMQPSKPSVSWPTMPPMGGKPRATTW